MEEPAESTVTYTDELCLTSSSRDEGVQRANADGEVVRSYDSKEQDCTSTIKTAKVVTDRKVHMRAVIEEGEYAIIYEGEFESSDATMFVTLPYIGEGRVYITRDQKLNFYSQLRLQSRLYHPNLVKLVVGLAGPWLRFITEPMSYSLAKYLRKIQRRHLDLKTSLAFALNVSQAMEYLHANGIIHHDLNTHNIHMTKDREQVKVLGYNLTIGATEDATTYEAEIFRSPRMAPELLRSHRKYNHKVDVYNFGFVWWQLLTDEPIPAVADQTSRPSFWTNFRGIPPFLSWCWADNPDLRPEFSEITNFLTDYLDQLR